MTTPLHVLIVEDSLDDADLLVLQLRRGGYDPIYERVETAAAMQVALDNHDWDLVVSDYSLPHFSAPAALEVLKSREQDIPFIVISGTVGEATAVAALKAGAHDFLLKGDMPRLIPAIQRELRDVEARKARHRAEEKVRRNNQRLEALHALDSAILSAQPPEQVVHLALRYLRGQISLERISLGIFDFEAQEAVMFAVQANSDSALSAGRRFRLASSHVHHIDILRRGEVYIVKDVATLTELSPEIREIYKAEGVGAYAAVPLLADGQLIGLLSLGVADSATLTSDSLEIAREVANQLAIAIHQSRLREQIEQHTQELERRVLERTAELNRNKERVEAILNSTADGILLASYDAVVQQVNPAFTRLLGYTGDEIFGHSLLFVAAPPSQELLYRTLDNLVNNHQTARVELKVQRKDGIFFDAELALAPVIESNVIRGIVCNMWDISTRKQLESNLRSALKKEQELSEMKSRFVSMVSHEFRTPLTVILSSSELLKQYGDRLTTDRKSTHLAKIETQVKRLTEMLDDVLTLYKAESGKLDFNPTPHDLLAFCQDIVEEMQAITGQNHQIALTHQGEDYKADIDEKLMRQVLSNLLSNAIKYSPQGKNIYFEVACDPEHATISVRDEGVGIPEEDQEHLFERFYRAKNVSSIQGTGIGLVIVKHAVEAHGGTITFTSAVNEGTTFILTIPRHHPQAHLSRKR